MHAMHTPSSKTPGSTAVLCCSGVCMSIISKGKPRLIARQSSLMQHTACLCNAAAEEVRPLVDAGCYQQAAIAAPLNDQLVRPAVALLVKVLSTCLQHIQQYNEGSVIS